MNKYTIEITETLQRQIEIEANDHDEAFKIIKRKYRNGEIVLDSNDYIDTDFHLIKETKSRENLER